MQVYSGIWLLHCGRVDYSIVNYILVVVKLILKRIIWQCRCICVIYMFTQHQKGRFNEESSVFLNWIEWLAFWTSSIGDGALQMRSPCLLVRLNVAATYIPWTNSHYLPCQYFNTPEVPTTVYNGFHCGMGMPFQHWWR